MFQLSFSQKNPLIKFYVALTNILFFFFFSHMQQLCLTEDIILLIDVMSAIVPKGFWKRALQGCWKWHFALISPVRLLNRRTDHLLVKLLPHNLELGPNESIVIDFILPFLVPPLTPVHENRTVAEKSALLITTAFCSHTELTVTKLRFSSSPLLITLPNATGFSTTLPIGLCGFWITQTKVSVLPGMIILYIESWKPS